MPGQVPLSNAQFVNSPDFNNQAIQGITGSGVFRQFGYLNTGTNSRTIISSDVWTTIELTGNSVVTVPSGISANVGDEILFVNTTGIISFTGNILSPAVYYANPPGRPARLVYAGSDYWILAGDKRGFTATTLFDCCGNNQSSAYTFQSVGGYSFLNNTAYASQYGTALYNVTALGGIVKDGSDNAYTIVSGAVNTAACTTVNFNEGYPFYNSSGGGAGTLYTFTPINILENSEILGKPFKVDPTSNVYICDTVNAVSGTYYRGSDPYGGTLPVCFDNRGVVISIGTCLTP